MEVTGEASATRVLRQARAIADRRPCELLEGADAGARSPCASTSPATRDSGPATGSSWHGRSRPDGEVDYFVTDFRRLPTLALLVGLFVAAVLAGRTVARPAVAARARARRCCCRPVRRPGDPRRSQSPARGARRRPRGHGRHPLPRPRRQRDDDGRDRRDRRRAGADGRARAWCSSTRRAITGFASEDAVFARSQVEGLDLRGLVLAGLIIAALGVLDDVTVRQASTVFALHEHRPDAGVRGAVRPRHEGRPRPHRVGRQHAVPRLRRRVAGAAGAVLDRRARHRRDRQLRGPRRRDRQDRGRVDRADRRGAADHRARRASRCGPPARAVRRAAPASPTTATPTAPATARTTRRGPREPGRATCEQHGVGGGRRAGDDPEAGRSTMARRGTVRRASGRLRSAPVPGRDAGPRCRTTCREAARRPRRSARGVVTAGRDRPADRPGVIMVGIGLTLTVGGLPPGGAAPRGHGGRLARQLLVMPALGFVIIAVLDLDPAIAVGWSSSPPARVVPPRTWSASSPAPTWRCRSC